MLECVFGVNCLCVSSVVLVCCCSCVSLLCIVSLLYFGLCVDVVFRWFRCYVVCFWLLVVCCVCVWCFCSRFECFNVCLCSICSFVSYVVALRCCSCVSLLCVGFLFVLWNVCQCMCCFVVLLFVCFVAFC